jgi:REP element-mobilizing transposase RayT
MARPLRLEIPDGTYHLWNRGVNRADIVFDDRDRELFVELLQEVIRRFGWIIQQFVLMTNISI